MISFEVVERWRDMEEEERNCWRFRNKKKDSTVKTNLSVPEWADTG